MFNQSAADEFPIECTIMFSPLIQIYDVLEMVEECVIYSYTHTHVYIMTIVHTCLYICIYQCVNYVSCVQMLFSVKRRKCGEVGGGCTQDT